MNNFRYWMRQWTLGSSIPTSVLTCTRSGSFSGRWLVAAASCPTSTSPRTLTACLRTLRSRTCDESSASRNDGLIYRTDGTLIRYEMLSFLISFILWHVYIQDSKRRWSNHNFLSSKDIFLIWILLSDLIIVKILDILLNIIRTRNVYVWVSSIR